MGGARRVIERKGAIESHRQAYERGQRLVPVRAGDEKGARRDSVVPLLALLVLLLVQVEGHASIECTNGVGVRDLALLFPSRFTPSAHHAILNYGSSLSLGEDAYDVGAVRQLLTAIGAALPHVVCVWCGVGCVHIGGQVIAR